ncbi:MAG: hypothetical protein DRH30_08515 [Deltaproteobacteria bacterium]|nr:MAG: hypothetical protein DRH30_08515 [Deltaproteobacteria bacterium]
MTPGVQLSFRNLFRRPRRTALTVFGIALAASIYIVLASLGQSQLRAIQTTVNSLQCELIVQQAGASMPQKSWLTNDHLHQLQTVAHVTRLMAATVSVARIVDSPEFLILGIGPEAPIIPGIRLIDGLPFTPGTNEAMVGIHTARSLGVEVGGDLEIRRRRFKVSGIFDSDSELLDRSMMAPLSTVQEMLHLGDRANLIFVTIDDVENQQRVRDEILRRFTDLEVSPAEGWISLHRNWQLIAKSTQKLGSLAMVLTVLVVWNVLTISVSERTREIGILRTIGWQRPRLVVLVLTEGLMMSCVGALLGIPLAYAILQITPLYESLVLAPSIPLSTIAEGVALTFLAGALGSLPALTQTVRIKPAVALRWYG